MSHSISIASFAFAALSAFSLSVSAQAADIESPSSISIPCESGGTKSCKVGLRSCAKVKKDFIQGISQEMQVKIEGYYRGKDLATQESVDWNHLAGADTGSTACNLMAGEVDHTNPTNGAKFEGARLEIPARPAASCGEFLEFKRDGIDNRLPRGLREKSYLAGAWNQVLVIKEAEVINEVNSGTLRVSPACQGIAADVSKYYKAASQISSALSSKASDLCSSADQKKMGELSTADLCKGSADLGKVDLKDLESHRMTACHLAAAREGIEAAFKHLGVCEVFARADTVYQKAFMASDGPFQSRLHEMTSQCMGQSDAVSKEQKCFLKFWKGCIFRTEYINPNKYYGENNRCYRQRYPEVFQRFMRENLPAPQSCTALGDCSKTPVSQDQPSKTQSALSQTMFSVIAWVSERISVNAYAESRLAQGILLGPIFATPMGSHILHSVACASVVAQLPCKLFSCCPSNRPNPTAFYAPPGAGGPTTFVPTGSSTINQSSQSVAKILGTQGPVRSSLVAAADLSGGNAHAAIADALNGSGSGGGANAGDLLKGLANGSGGGAGSRSGSGSGSASGFSLGNTRTAAADQVNDSPTQMTGSDDLKGGYGGGAGKGSSGDKSSSGMGIDFASLLGAGAGGVKGGGGASEVGFGEDSKAADEARARALAALIRSKDPSDYFSMHQPGDNIFKIVERRYGMTVKTWALTDATATANEVKKLSR